MKMKTKRVSRICIALAAIAVCGGPLYAEPGLVPVPKGYRTVDYIESTGRELLDTGIDSGPATAVELRFGRMRRIGDRSDVLFGGSGFTHWTYLLVWQGDDLKFYGHGDIVVPGFRPERDYTLRLDGNDVTVRASDGQTYAAKVETG